MSKAEIKQLYSNRPTTIIYKYLKFCSLIIALFLNGCGGKKSQETTLKSSSEDNIETIAKSTVKVKTILCFGDSITAGYGLDNSNDGYPGVLQKKIDSLDLNYAVINSGVSGETTAGGKSRIGWVIKQPIDVFLLELGANDGLRGVSPSETRANLQAIIDVVRKKSPKTIIILAGMQLPPNMGQEYANEFKAVFVELAQKNKLEFIPFILKDVGGIAALNQNDGIHPTVEGHRIVANTVWEILKPLITS